MVELISGRKGKGKTKYLLDEANKKVVDATGTIVYLDKSSKHMYELNNKVRLINVFDYKLDSCDAFIGFLCGVTSQDHDLTHIYIDSFLKLAHLEDTDITIVIEKLEELSNMFHVDFTISISLDNVDLPEAIRQKVIIAL